MFRVIALFAAFSASATALAQEKEPVSHIRLDFVLKETEGSKVVNSRSYVAQLSTARNANTASIRTGNRIPIVSGADEKLTYFELGVSIDCSQARVEDGQLSIHIIADVSDALQESPRDTVAARSGKPAIRQSKWSGDVLLAWKKPTLVFSLDDLNTKHQMQLEVTATQIK